MSLRVFTVLLLSLTTLCVSHPARASLTMSIYLGSISQIGDGSAGVSLGHTVYARTNLSKLHAGGTFNASCISSFTGSIPGQRSLPSGLIGAPNVLYVTIPEWVPTVRNMPGFENAPPGTVLSCTYAWTARAVEGHYTVGIPGFNTTIGGEEVEDGGSIGFYMYKSGDGGEPNRGCIH
jgi:hypothetical protein